MILRPFQNQALAALRSAVRGGQKRLILCAPTGAGKTVIAAELCRCAVAKDSRVLFLVPRRELAFQAAEKLLALGLLEGRDVSIYMAGVAGAEEIGSTAAVTVASKDTLTTRKRLDRIKGYPSADLVIVDECHLSMSNTWLELLEHYRQSGATIVGLTATPARESGKPLGDFYQTIVRTPGIAELTDMDYLVPARYFTPTAPDLKRLKKVRGDFAKGELAERVNTPKLVGDAIATYLERGEARQAICFAVDVRHSIALAEKFRGAGVSVEHIDGRMSTADREAVMGQFAAGKFAVLCNCQIATYGLDVPRVSCLILARPTASLVLHLQILGRGLRTSEATGKRDCLIFDHAGNIERLGMADSEHEWSLETGGKKAEPRKTKQGEKVIEHIECHVCHARFKPQPKCPECGHKFETKGQGVTWVGGMLVERSNVLRIDGIKQRKRFYLELLGYCEKYGKKRGMALFRYRDKYGEDPAYNWRNLDPLPPSQETMNYVKAGLIAHAKRRERPGTLRQEARTP
ncbi:MAG: DEAD/DEAH box helicase [Pseudomonadota bacterium]